MSLPHTETPAQPPSSDLIPHADEHSPAPSASPAPQLKTQNSKLKTHLLPLGVFLLLSVLFTWPLLLNFGDHVVSNGDSGDIWAHLWNIWWVKHALTVLHTSPFHTDYIFYPGGVSLRFHALNQLGGLISIPLQALFGLIPAFNTLVLFNLTMAGFGAYLLARYVLTLINPDRQPSLLPCLAAGIAFAYSAGESSFVRLGQLELMSIEWLPFATLFLLRAVLGVGVESYKLQVESGNSVGERNSTPSPEAGSASKRTFNFQLSTFNSSPNFQLSTFNSSPIFHALAAAFFIMLAAQQTWYYGLYLLIFAALIGLYALIVRWRQGWAVRLLIVRQLAIAVGGFGLAVSWQLLPMVQELRSQPQLASPLNTIVYNAVDPLSLFRPGPSLLWGVGTIADASWYIGAVAGLLALIGLFVAIRQRRSRSMAIFLFLSALFFLALALGPYLKLQPGGVEALAHLGANGPTIPLPFLLLDKLPFIGGIARIADRYTIMAMLCLGLLAAIALDYLMRWQTVQGWQRALRTALPLILVALMMVEALPTGGQPLLQPSTPAFFSRIASDPPGSYALIELPLRQIPLYMYYQTTHQQELLGGYTSRHYDYPFGSDTPVVHQLYNDARPADEFDIIERNLSATGQAVLNYYKIRYVVVHEDLFLNENERNLMHDVLSQVWPTTPPQRDGNLSIYTVAPPTNTVQPALEFGAGWYSLERSAPEGSYRWTNGNATLSIWSPQPLTATLTTTVLSHDVARHLDVVVNGRTLASQPIGPADVAFSITLNLPAGMNQIVFHTPEPPTVASAADPRIIALRFKKITLTAKGAK